MKRFLLIPLLVLLGGVLVLSGCGAPAPAPPPSPAPKPAVSPAPAPSPTSAPAPAATPVKQKTWTLKLSHNQTNINYMHVYGHEPWAKDVERVTKGRVKVEIYPNSTLMLEKGSWEGTKSGIAEVSWFSTWKFPGQFEFLDSTALPFIMHPKAEVCSRVAWTLFQKYPEIQSQFADVKMLTVWTTEPYIFATSKKQIKTLEDFRGLKMRMTTSPSIEMMKLLGGVPLTVTMPDCYMNLQKGVMDGMATPAEAVVGFRLYEVLKYFTMVPTTCSPQMLIMNKEAWNELPPDIQQAIMSVSGESLSMRYGKMAFDKSWEELPDIATKAGYNLVNYTPPQEEIDRWVAVAGKPVWDNWVKTVKAKGCARAQEILDETIKLVKQYGSG